MAAFEDAVEGGAEKDQIIDLAERAHRASDLIPDETWTDDQRRLLDLLNTFDAAFTRWESGEPAREVEPRRNVNRKALHPPYGLTLW